MKKDINQNETGTILSTVAPTEARSDFSDDDRAEAQQWLRPGEKPFESARRYPHDCHGPMFDIPHYL